MSEPTWVGQALEWANSIGGEDGADIRNILEAHFGDDDVLESAPVEGGE
jgi:hypothetical protein